LDGSCVVFGREKLNLTIRSIKIRVIARLLALSEPLTGARRINVNNAK